MPASPILPLPTAGSKDFTAKRGAGEFHNLYHALHQASASSQSTLHVLRPHIDAITKAFDTSSIKQAIRAGGLSQGQQQTVLKKILANDPKLHDNAVAKKALKNVVKHFTKEQSDFKKRMILRRRSELQEEAPIVSPGAGSINQIVNRKKEQPPVTAGTVYQPTRVGSISELRNRPTSPTAVRVSPSRPPGSGAFRPPLVK